MLICNQDDDIILIFFSSFPLSYTVDGADKEKFELSRKELHELITKPQLAGIPLLLLGNKNDLAECVSLEELVKIMSGFLSMFIDPT